MLKKIFLPEFFNKQRVYSQTILGFYIENSWIKCVKVLSGRTNNIVKAIEKEKINVNSKKEKEYAQQISIGIKKIIERVGKYDQVHIAIPTSKIIFKEIEVPFLDEDKIRMILEYEVETKLPFSVQDSVLDFIVTKQYIQEKKSQILVSAIRNQDIEEALSFYQNADVEPTKITIDLFSIYSLFQQIPDYKNLKNSNTIIDIGNSSTRIAMLQDGHLKLTRTIPQGINTIIKKTAEETKENKENIKEKINKFGFLETDNKEYNKILQKHAISFFHEIQFTLNSFTLKLNLDKAIGKILFTGTYSNLKNLTIFCKNILQVPCIIFDTSKIFSDPHFIDKTQKSIQNWNNYMISLGAALPSNETLQFNLRRKDFAEKSTRLLKKQVITSLSLVFVLLLTLLMYGYVQINQLSQQIKNIKEQETQKLLKIFPEEFKLPKKIAFKSLINRAGRLISEKLEMWGPFEKQQIQPLLILHELTNIIDKRKFDVTIENVSISEEDEKAKIEIEGFFRSKTGSDHFKNFKPLAKRFEDSEILEFWNEEEEENLGGKPVEDKGIRFSAKLKLKE